MLQPLASSNDRLIGAVHSRLGHALHTATTDASLSVVVAETEATDEAAAMRGGIFIGTAEPGPWPARQWQANGKRSTAVRHVQDQAVAHERRALAILRDHYGQPDCDLL